LATIFAAATRSGTSRPAQIRTVDTEAFRCKLRPPAMANSPFVREKATTQEKPCA